MQVFIFRVPNTPSFYFYWLVSIPQPQLFGRFYCSEFINMEIYFNHKWNHDWTGLPWQSVKHGYESDSIFQAEKPSVSTIFTCRLQKTLGGNILLPTLDCFDSFWAFSLDQDQRFKFNFDFWGWNNIGRIQSRKNRFLNYCCNSYSFLYFRCVFSQNDRSWNYSYPSVSLLPHDDHRTEENCLS